MDETGRFEESPERAAAINELSAEFGEMLGQVRQIFRDASDTVSPGLQPVAYQTLSFIARANGATVSTLADRMGTDKSVVSRAVRDLEHLELIQRTTDPDDRRSALIVLTDLGRERLDAARDPMRSRFRSTLLSWPEEDITALTRLLHALIHPDADPHA